MKYALAAGIAWGLAALLVWAWIRAATRPVVMPYREPDDGIQPWDARSFTLASGGSWTYTAHD